MTNLLLYACGYIYYPCHSFMKGLIKCSEHVPPCTVSNLTCVKANKVNVSIA